MGHIKKLSTFLIYSLSSIISRLMVFMPIFLSLNTQDFGLWTHINRTGLIISSILACGLVYFLRIEFFRHNYEGQTKLINNFIFIYLAVSIPILVIIFLNINIINRFVFGHTATTAMLILTFITAFFTFFSDFFYQVIRCKNSPLLLACVQLGSAIITAGLIFYKSQYTNLNTYNIIVINFIATLIPTFSGVLIYIYNKYYETFIIPNISTVNKYIKNGLHFLPIPLAPWLLPATSGSLLINFATLKDAGVFSLANMSLQLFELAVIQPLQGSYFLHTLERFSYNPDKVLEIEKDNKKRMLKTSALSLIMISALYFSSRPLLIKYLSTDYCESIKLMYYLMLAGIFSIAGHFQNCLAQYLKKTRILAFLWCLPAIINAIAGFILIPTLQSTGAAIATILAYLGYAIASSIYNIFLVSKLLTNSLKSN